MKVVPPKKMGYLEMEAYRDGSSKNDFMEEAGSGVALVVQDFAERYGIARQIALLCGKGNNAGDAYVAGIHLLHLEYSVHAFQIPPLSECTELTKKNALRFVNEGGHIIEVKDPEDMKLPEQGILIDGLFGTGFKGDVKEPYASAINAANESGLIIISVDIPSGLNGETGEVSEATIDAIETAYLGLPKTGFFLNEGWDKVGNLRYVDFGLPQDYIEEVDADLILITPEMLLPLLPRFKRSRHKYEAGLVTGLAGSTGMPGAALLSSLAVLRAGAGMIKLLFPAGMEGELGSYPLEIVKIPYEYSDVKDMIDLINLSSACFIGPGLGHAKEIKDLLRLVIPNVQVPAVIDADALNFLAEEDIRLPVHTILTPHKGELARLLKMQKIQRVDADLLRLCQGYAEEKQVTLIMKGGPTFIFHPNEPIHVNGTGDPGMATAGTGDVLTGLLASLLAQKLTPFDAARVGTYIHGLAGEHAVQEKTPYCMIASDLFDYFPAAFAFEPS